MSEAEQTREQRVLENLTFAGLVATTLDISRRWHITATELVGRSRSRGIVEARHCLMYQIRHDSEREYSFKEIGRLLEMDHSSVIHGEASHARWLAVRAGVISTHRMPATPSETARCA